MGKNLWVFDNDGTLYDDTLAEASYKEILCSYISNMLKIPISEAWEKAKELKQKWETDLTPVALVREFGIGFSELVEKIHMKIDFNECKIPICDSEKRDSLCNIGAPKIVFTNNPAVFARKVLAHIGLEHCFMDFVGAEETDFRKKTDPEAYKIIEKRYPKFNRFIFCDNSIQNLNTARSCGWLTIWYNPKDESAPGSATDHFSIRSFKELENIPV
jgi:putative hydrolase of the HAD superfamily